MKPSKITNSRVLVLEDEIVRASHFGTTNDRTHLTGLPRCSIPLCLVFPRSYLRRNGRCRATGRPALCPFGGRLSRGSHPPHERGAHKRLGGGRNNQGNLGNLSSVFIRS